MSVASRELRPIQVPLTARITVNSAPGCRSQPQILLRRGVKRKLFGITSDDGDDINQLIQECNDRNHAHLWNQYNFDSRAVAANEINPKGSSSVSGSHPSIVKHGLSQLTTPMPVPTLIATELKNFQQSTKAEEEQCPRRTESTEATSMQASSRKCNVPQASNNERAQLHFCSKQTLTTDYFCVRKNVQCNEGKLPVTPQLRSMPASAAAHSHACASKLPDKLKSTDAASASASTSNIDLSAELS